MNKHEKYLGADQPPPDEALHRLRFAHTFHDRLLARVSADPLAIRLISLMKDGVSTPRELAEATGQTLGAIVEGRRRIKYHAGEITKELSASAGTSRADSGSEEVTQ